MTTSLQVYPPPPPPAKLPVLRERETMIWYVTTVYSIWTLVQVKQFESLQCNFGALPWDGPEAVYHRSAGESLSDFLSPSFFCCYRMVKIALSLIESKHRGGDWIGLFPPSDSVGLQYIGSFPHCLITYDVLPHNAGRGRERQGINNGKCTNRTFFSYMNRATLTLQYT